MFPPACSLTAANGRTERKTKGETERGTFLAARSDCLRDWLVCCSGSQADSGSRSAVAQAFPTADLEAAGSKRITENCISITSHRKGQLDVRLKQEGTNLQPQLIHLLQAHGALKLHQDHHDEASLIIILLLPTLSAAYFYRPMTVYALNKK